MKSHALTNLVVIAGPLTSMYFLFNGSLFLAALILVYSLYTLFKMLTEKDVKTTELKQQHFQSSSNAIKITPPKKETAKIKNELRIVGVSFENEDGTSRQKILSRLMIGDKIELRHSPTSEYQSRILAFSELGCIGSISDNYAKILLKNGFKQVKTEISSIGIGKNGLYGLKIFIEENCNLERNYIEVEDHIYSKEEKSSSNSADGKQFEIAINTKINKESDCFRDGTILNFKRKPEIDENFIIVCSNTRIIGHIIKKESAKIIIENQISKCISKIEKLEEDESGFIEIRALIKPLENKGENTLQEYGKDSCQITSHEVINLEEPLIREVKFPLEIKIDRTTKNNLFTSVSDDEFNWLFIEFLLFYYNLGDFTVEPRLVRMPDLENSNSTVKLYSRTYEIGRVPYSYQKYISQLLNS